MIGDKLVIKNEHTAAANGITEILIPWIKNSDKIVTVSIAGESGAGKSEIAFSLHEQLEEKGFHSIILQQDDYFIYPPKTNAKMREKNIEHVGISEVHLDIIDKNLNDILSGNADITKPLVLYEEDRITSETVSLSGISAVIVEGTYTTLLEQVGFRVFIDRNYLDTRQSRRERSREPQDAYLEKILKIEHGIISKHKKMCDILVSRDYSVSMNERH